MNVMLMKVSVVIAALTSLHVGFAALGYDLCKPFHGKLKFYLDIISGIAGAVVLVGFFMY